MFSLLCVCAHSAPFVWMGGMLRNVFDSCVKSWEYFCMDSVSLESMFHWLSDDIVRFKIKVGFFGEMYKNVTLISHKMEFPSVLWHCWLGGRKGIRPVKNWVMGCWHGCLGRGADLHIAQQMPLPLTVSCSSKSRLVLPFLVLPFLVLPFWYLLSTHPSNPGQIPEEQWNGCVCVCVISCKMDFLHSPQHAAQWWAPMTSLSLAGVYCTRALLGDMYVNV